MTNNDGDELTTTTYDDEIPDMHAYRNPPEEPEVAQVAEEATVTAQEEVVDDEENDNDTSRPSIATQLAVMAREFYTFGVDENGETFACDNALPHVALSMSNNSRGGLKARLLDQWSEASGGRVAPGAAATDAMGTLDWGARRNPVTPVHMRIADHDGTIYLDCADEQNRVIVIDSGRWRVADEDVPVVFRRSTFSLPYPVPEGESDLALLWDHLNVDPDDRPLVLGWVVAALVLENVPHPVLYLGGEHGTAKTSAARVLQSLVDPTTADTRNLPSDEGAWVATVRQGWALTFDNLSELSKGMNDGLCKLSTGDTIVRRILYTTDEASATKAYRPLIITAINLTGVQPDLEDRMVRIELSAIPPSKRRLKKEVEASWERDRSRVLAGLLDLAAKVHHRLPDVATPEGFSRMADFHQVVAAIDDVQGTSGADRYQDAAVRAARDTLAEYPLARAIVNGRRDFEATTAGQILNAMAFAKGDGREGWGWPENARAASNQLRDAAPSMRKLGWTVHDDMGKNEAGTKKYTIHAPSRESSKAEKPAPSSPSDPSPQVNTISSARSGAESISVAAVSPEIVNERTEAHPARDGAGLARDRSGEIALTSTHGSNGDDGDGPGTAVAACRFCGAELTVGHAAERGYCARPECSAAHVTQRQQPSHRSTPTPLDIANMGRRPADRPVV
ncbi:hypothetical protein [Mycolicibacter senuensis]|uniref:hypothetical protein n=1 Tax=Mycolicibacter senuensis TaxID=386913 RepID=UPI001057AC0B|nr:hypothetical protein [Mycolicibacter senuensis]